MIRALLAALCFFVGAASAATIDPRMAKHDVCGRFEVFHINGIMTTRDQAVANRDRIQQVYGNAYSSHLIKYFLAYNQTRGFTTDLYQSALQVISGYAGATWDKFMNAVTFGVYSIGMPEATAKAIAKVVTDKFYFTRPSPYQDQDLADIMHEFQQQTGSHARKVFVPHSQGNLYMNLLYDQLIATGWAAKSIGVVGMAVPYSSVRSGNTFVTSANDVVIDATRLPTLNNILGPTLTIPYAPTVDVLGHNLRNTYLANSTARSQMVSKITSEFNGLRTTAPSPVWSWYLTYNKVGYWGGNLCSAAYPCTRDVDGQSVQFTTPILWYGVVNSPYNMVTRPATLTEATSIALSNAQLCYQHTIAEELRLRTAGQMNPNGRYIWGCLVMPNYRTNENTWHAYSGDLAPSYKATYYVAGSSVDVIAGATCKN